MNDTFETPVKTVTPKTPDAPFKLNRVIIAQSRTGPTTFTVACETMGEPYYNWRPVKACTETIDVNGGAKFEVKVNRELDFEVNSILHSS